MTDDLVKQAREFAALIMDGVFLSGSSTHDLLVGMSDRIEQLEAALREIAGMNIICASDYALNALKTIGSAALAGENKDD